MSLRGINKVILIGNLGQNPIIRYTSSGNAVTNITLATSENWKDKNSGKVKDKTEWHRIVLFGKLAEIACEYLHKGSQIYIEGYLQTRKWNDKNGNNRYITEIIVGLNGTMYMLGGKQNNFDSKKDNFKNDQNNLNKIKNLKFDNDNDNDNSSLEEDDSSINFDDDISF